MLTYKEPLEAISSSYIQLEKKLPYETHCNQLPIGRNFIAICITTGNKNT